MTELLATPAFALAAAAFTTWLAFLESRALPWAPFLLLYAVALPAFPLAAGTYAFGPPLEAFAANPRPILAWSAAMLAWEIGLAGHLYERRVLGRLGKAGSRDWSPARALDELLAAVARKTGWPASRV